MSEKKISVIIPVYNSANHLKATFDSLACQTMSASDFEIICVNDCSTDNSKEVIEHCAANMPNLKLINLPENTGGPMIPRNTGIEAASGRYIHFIDSDDFLGEEALERLYNAAEKYQSDVIFGRYVGVNGRSVPKSMFTNGNLPRVTLLNDQLVYSLAPHKMVKTSFLKAHNIRFYNGAKASNEDQWFVMQCYIKAKVITVLSDYDYYFIVARGNENFSGKIFPADQFLFIPNQVLKLMDQEIKDPIQNKKTKALYINWFLRTGGLFRKNLLNPKASAPIRKEWMREGKKFLDTFLDKQLISMADPNNVQIINILQTNNYELLEKLIDKKSQPYLQNKNKGYFAIARDKTLKTYIRPSANALQATPISQPDKLFQVFQSVEGWLEVRQPDNNGGTIVTFVKKKEISYSFETRMRTLYQTFKETIKNKVKA